MENFNDIINSNQLTLIDFYATWCGPCKMMHPVLEQLKSELGDTLRIIKLDVDKNEALSAQYRIQSVPTLMLAKVAFIGASLLVEHNVWSPVLGVIGCSCLWSILELYEQKKRVEKGWFPMNPKRKDEYR